MPSANFALLANGNGGLHTYSVDSSGNLTHIDSDDQGGSAKGVWSDGNFIYLTNVDTRLHTYSVDSSGNLTHIDSDNQSTGPAEDVWGDGNFIYLACGSASLLTYSVDSSGNLTYIGSALQGGDNALSVWGDGNFIYLANGAGGLHTYSVNSSGNLTHIDSDDQGDLAVGVWGDGNFIYLANNTGGLHTYSADSSGYLTHIDSDDQGDEATDVWGDGNFIYLANGNGGLRTYSVDGSGNLTHIDAGSQVDYAAGVLGDGNFIYLAKAVGYSGTERGLHTYSVDGSGNLTHIDFNSRSDDAWEVWAGSINTRSTSSSSNTSGGTTSSSSSNTSASNPPAAASGKKHYFAEYNCKDINTLAPDAVCDTAKRQFLKVNRHAVIRENGFPKNGGNTCAYNPAQTFHFVINYGGSSCNLYIHEPKPCESQIPLNLSNKTALDHCCECDSQSCSPYVPANSSLLAPKPSVDLRPGRYCFHQEFYTWPVISAPTKKNTQAMNESTACEPADNCGATYKHPHPGPEIVSIRVPRLFTEAEVKGKWIALDPKHGSEKYKFYRIDKPVHTHLSSGGNPSWGPSSSSSRRRTSASVTPSPSFWPPPPPCFLAGTKIAMADGTEKNIEDVVVGDTVKAFDIDSGEVINSLVPTIFVHPNTKGYYIINNDIKVTGNHPMRVGNEWKDVDSLKVGDKLHRLDGSEVNIETIDKIEDTVTTYNFEVENVHNYFANKYLAHNKTLIPTQGSSASLWRARWKCKDCGTGNDLYIADNPWRAGGRLWEMGLTIGKKYLTCEYPAGITCMQGRACPPAAPPCMPTGPLGYLQVFHPMTMYAIQAPNYPLNLNGQQGVIGNNCEWLGVDGQGNGLGPFTNIMGGDIQVTNDMCTGYGAYDPRGTSRYAHCCTPSYSSRAYKACCDEVGACGYELAKWENNRIVPAGVWGCHQMTYCQCKDYGALPTIWGTYYQGQGTTCGTGIALADTLPSKCSSSQVQTGTDIIGQDCQTGTLFPIRANGFNVSIGSVVKINSVPEMCVSIMTLQGVGAPMADIIYAYNDCTVCTATLGGGPIIAQQSSAGGSP
jgi:hypothetical protein